MAFLVPVVRTCYDHWAQKFKIGTLFYFHSHQNVEIRKNMLFLQTHSSGEQIHVSYSGEMIPTPEKETMIFSSNIKKWVN